MVLFDKRHLHPMHHQLSVSILSCRSTNVLPPLIQAHQVGVQEDENSDGYKDNEESVRPMTVEQGRPPRREDLKTGEVLPPHPLCPVTLKHIAWLQLPHGQPLYA